MCKEEIYFYFQLKVKMEVTTVESIENNEKRFVSSETGIVSVKEWTEGGVTTVETIEITHTEEPQVVGWGTSIWNYMTSFYS